MASQALLKAIKAAAFLTGNFTTRAGKQTDFYIDKYLFMFILLFPAILSFVLTFIVLFFLVNKYSSSPISFMFIF